MKYTTLIILQIIAFMITSYYLFPNAHKKKYYKRSFYSLYLAKQSVTLSLLAWLFSFQLEFLPFAILIGVIHFILSGCLSALKKQRLLSKFSFFLLEGTKIISILLICLLFKHLHLQENTMSWLPKNKTLWIGLCYIFCMIPANQWIREFFRIYRLKQHKKENKTEDTNAGRLIGVLERILVTTFVISNQFAAVGFLIAAKSILRFQDHETLKTEYVLIGTMLSFGTAIILALLANTIA